MQENPEMLGKNQELTEAHRLPPLPFNYIRTENDTEAICRRSRMSRIKQDGQRHTFTDEEILDDIRKQQEGLDWFTQEYWREKGIPQDQIECQIGDNQITVYNYNKDKPFTERHMEELTKGLSAIVSHFPSVLKNIRWILIDDIQTPSAFGNPDEYPLNGSIHYLHRSINLQPRAMGLFPHRVQAVSNFLGTFVHEFTHPMARPAGNLYTEWPGNWDQCAYHQDEWELRTTPDGTQQKWFHRVTGDMSTMGQISLEPNKCVTEYGRYDKSDDICDSAVTYLFAPELLVKVASEKKEALQHYDACKDAVAVTCTRVPQAEIRLPEVAPKTIHYYIEEPQQ